MWNMIASLEPVVEQLRPAFTLPSYATAGQLLLAWIMCLGRHTLRGVAEALRPDVPPDHSRRHRLDTAYNFFERSAWQPKVLAYRIAVLILTLLGGTGVVTLLVDDTLLHKRGQKVFGLGWFRDAVASTQKRVATASGHNWVIMAVAICLPGTGIPILALPMLARLHLPGKGQPSCPALAREMIEQVLAWFPGRRFTLVGDGAYAAESLLKGLEERVTFVGRLRGDAALYDPRVPRSRPGQRGRKATKGSRLPSPMEAAAKADRKRRLEGLWVWRLVQVLAYGQPRELKALSYEAVWPRVAGLRALRVVVVRDPSGRMRDCYLFTTDLAADESWVIRMFAWRWAIEVLFRSSKQVMEVEVPQHRSEEAVEKLAPWVWSMQSVVMVWYVTCGRESSSALEMRERMGDWESEWSLRHMVQVLRREILNATIDPMSADGAQLREFVTTLKNWANMAA
jgi:hypothetical protein